LIQLPLVYELQPERLLPLVYELQSERLLPLVYELQPERLLRGCWFDLRGLIQVGRGICV
jgi:hypothetical protein